MTITILGCGTSAGVPRIGNNWGNCDPHNPKNRRRRASLFVEAAGAKILIDSGPDLREQCLAADIRHIDGLLYTHDHGDHTHGIDDLRPLSHLMKQSIAAYGNTKTMQCLRQRFDYIFAGKAGYPAFVEGHNIDDTPFSVAGVKVQAIPLMHGPITSFGYRLNKMAYTTDFNAIPEESETHLYGLDLWIVDALRYDPHPTHTHLAQTLDWIKKFRPKQAILTHMAGEMDYQTLKDKLPKGVTPAYDGLKISLPYAP